MKKVNGDGFGRLLEALADEATFGMSLDDYQNPIPDDVDDIREQHRNEMMQMASLIQLSFLRRDEPACQEMPDRVRSKIMNKANEFLSAQKISNNVAEIVSLVDKKSQ